LVTRQCGFNGINLPGRITFGSEDKPKARAFYEAESLRDGWPVRQLDRQIGTQFSERTLLSRDQVAMLKKGQHPKPDDALTPEEEIKDPFVLCKPPASEEYFLDSLALIERYRVDDDPASFARISRLIQSHSATATPTSMAALDRRMESSASFLARSL
jgi:hypothetical protein